jgi:uncharacterized membrane protein YphA (DoxX/SURF4 family)
MSTIYTKYRDRYVSHLDRYSEYAVPVMRIGLGGVIFLAGAHKLVAPDVWTEYAAPWVTALWPESVLSFELVMMANGVFELLFGIALIAGFYTTIVAGVITLSLLAVVFDLATGAIQTGKFVDILIRDIGLVALALGVTLLSAQQSRSTADPRE